MSAAIETTRVAARPRAVLARPRAVLGTIASATWARLRGLGALALDFATAAPSVTRVARRWRRSWSATVARSAIALIAVWVVAVGWPGAFGEEASAAGGPSIWAAAPILAYLLTLGVAVDHYGARHGIAGSYGLHVLGVLLFMPVMWRIALADPAVRVGHGGATLEVVAAWPVVFLGLSLIGYAAAWIVPGSFPRQYRFARAAAHVLRTGTR